MIDRLFNLVLTLCVLIGGTAAIGTELFSSRADSDARVATLPRVVITGKKQPATTEVARAEGSASSERTAKFTQ